MGQYGTDGKTVAYDMSRYPFGAHYCTASHSVELVIDVSEWRSCLSRLEAALRNLR